MAVISQQQRETYAFALYSISGDKSSVIDIDNPDLTEFPRFAEVTRYECFLEPGDVLFIPALWFHNVISIGQFIM